jgi:NAD-dependent SIR2 family protein deacetylase
MKLEIYTADQVFAVAKLLEQVYNLYPATTPEQKATRSIAFDLEEKFSSKRKQLIKNNNLFEVGKTHKMKLKYHEELALQKIITDLLDTINDIKPKNDLLIVRNYLHQKVS